MLKRSVLMTTLIFMSASTLTYAAARSSGAYLEGNVGTNYASVAIFNINATKFGSVGANANLGYQFNRYFGLETGFTQYMLGDHSINGIDAATKFILPFEIGNNNLSVFAKLGASSLGGNHSHREMAAFAGLGLGYSLTQNLDVTLQTQAFSQGWFSLGLLSGGLTYHFN